MRVQVLPLPPANGEPTPFILVFDRLGDGARGALRNPALADALKAHTGARAVLVGDIEDIEVTGALVDTVKLQDAVNRMFRRLESAQAAL